MDDAQLRLLIQESVNRAIARMRVPMLRPGTVLDEFGPVVLVDGDDDGTTVPSICGPVIAGDRVMVMFHPPAGAVVVGRIGTSGSADAPLTAVYTITGVGLPWTKPTGARLIELILIGGGGGGGTGRSDVNGTLRPGGGGGGGAGYSHVIIPASMMDVTETVTVGAGGAGGVNPGAVVSNGATGTSGATSSITTLGSSILAGGGVGGGGGSAASGGLGGAGGRGLIMGSRGGKAANDGGVGRVDQQWRTNEQLPQYPQALSNLSDSGRACPGGGSGGGITAANVGADGGDGTMFAPTNQAPATGGVTGAVSTPAGNGLSETGLWMGGGSGGGGAAFGGPPPVSGGKGGNGGNYGAGGGGGSGKSSGSVVGDGGNGGDGVVVVITHL